MKKSKTILFITVIAVGLTACAKKIPADEVKGNYNGTQHVIYPLGDTTFTVTCIVAKKNDNMVLMTTDPLTASFDSISVIGTASPFTLVYAGSLGSASFSGSVNGNTLTWNYIGFTGDTVSFTGTK